MDTPKIEDLSGKIKTVIGNILKNADSTCKRVLTLFDSSKDPSVNIGKLSTASRPELEKLCEFLKIPLFQDDEQKKKMFSSKKILAKRIVMEIMSLYPTMCPECSEEYRVMQGHQPDVRCWICLQGAHDCAEFTGKMGVYMNLPAMLTTMVWLCYDCLTVNNPFPLSSSDNKSGYNTPLFDRTLNSRNTTHESLPNGNETTKSSSSLENGNLTRKLEDVLDKQQKAESKPNTCKHVCPRLIEGSCPHGVSGKKAAEAKQKCELFHPKRCRRYMSHYTHETKGCTEGDNCDSLHVNLCQSSIDSKKCDDVNCKGMHLVGTKRPKSMLKKKTVPNAPQEQDDTDQTKPVRKRTKSEQNSSNKKKKERPPKSKPTTDDSFLEMTSRLDEMKSTLVEELKVTVQREINSVRTEMDLFKQQLELLKIAISPQPAAYNPAMAYCGPFKPTPCEMPPYHQMWMQRERFPSQQQPPTMTPIPPAFC